MRLLELLIKGAGHKYIKRIPVGTTKSGTTRYRYIYSSTSTVGGKNLLDEAHLKPGTKLMLQSKDGAEVHAHIESVDGDQVTFKYDDGDRKGETRTVSKQKLLGEFNQENKVGEQIESAKAALLADIKAAADRGTTPKQLARLIARLERLGGSIDKEDKQSGVVLPKLAKELLAKHQVSADQVNTAEDSFLKSATSLSLSFEVREFDGLYFHRLRNLTGEGLANAVDTYNNALQRAAEDNADLLRAIESYNTELTPIVELETLNETIERRRAGYEDCISAFIFEAYDVPEEGRGNLTYNDLKGIRRVLANQIKEQILIDTDIDIEETGLTISEVYGSAPALEIVANQAEIADKAKRDNVALESAIEASCSAFILEDISANGLHQSHTLHAKNREDIMIASRYSTELNKIEQVFRAAYPERKTNVAITREEGTRSSATSKGDQSTLFLSEGHNLGTAAHELAHTLEGNKYTPAGYHKAIQEAVTLTHISRVQAGKNIVYHDKERAFDDDYNELYTGKLYGSGASELVSMGVENMFKAKSRSMQIRAIKALAISDPHLYLVTYAILKGYTKYAS